MAGVRSTFPAPSVARTRNLCRPGATFTRFGELHSRHAFRIARTRRHPLRNVYLRIERAGLTGEFRRYYRYRGKVGGDVHRTRQGADTSALR